jgi:eukaryotic-like serine/threonine-protein kinase
MADEPSVALTDLLSKLRVATPEQVRTVRVRARRLARDLPLFDSVWIDALAQARLLTPFQAREINAGRGELLLVGSYVLRRRVQHLGHADCFVAAEIDVEGSEENKSRRKSRTMVHLVVARGLEPAEAAKCAARILTTAARLAVTSARDIQALRAAGCAGDVVWAAYNQPMGSPADEWLSCHGRFSPDAALEIARQMVAALAALEKTEIVHGNLATSSVWLTGAGEVQLARCGWQGARRCDENSPVDADVLDALDYTAPERLNSVNVSDQPSASSDLYACGALWWHLLAGRPPLTGGCLETKLRAARDGKIASIRTIAPDVSKILATVIEQCLQRDPAQRPRSFGELQSMLGPSTGTGRRLLALELFRSGRSTNRGDLPRKIQSVVEGAGQPLFAATTCALLLAAATWPFWRSRHPTIESRPTASTAAENGDHRVPTVENGLAIFRQNRPATVSHRTVHDHTDREVRPASFQTHSSATGSQDNQPAALTHRSVIELSDTGEIAGNSLRLQPGTIVRGKESLRPRIVVPPNGLTVTADQVRFENVDFIWRPRPEEITSPDRHALIELKTGAIEFAGCTFQAQAVDSFELPTAIRLGNNLWRGTALAPAMRVDVERCVISGVACGIDCAARGPAAIAARNTLYLGKGPLVQFSQARRVDAAASVTLAHVTLRAARAAIELDNDDDSNGTIVVNTSACVFAPQETGSLVLFCGQRKPRIIGGVLAALDWNCQDSLISPGMTIAAWQHDQAREMLSDEMLPLEGLVASQFDFADEASSNPSDSKLQRWLAPVRTESTPGIGDDLPQPPDLPKPKVSDAH